MSFQDAINEDHARRAKYGHRGRATWRTTWARIVDAVAAFVARWP